MEQPVAVSTYQGRLNSFSTEHHLSKRRASSVKKRTPQTVSWPHKSPQPEELARAGFFYKPTGDSDDNCMCFVCQRQLDGWEAGDDPIAEHLKHAPDCGWAIHASITETFKNGGQVTEDPMSEQFVQARLDTFGDYWPYEQKKGWKCKVAKMVTAGWCYDPSPECNDGVSCSYCSLSLDGWEKNDDPFVEHQQRAANCDYFKLVEEWSLAREQVKTKKSRGRPSKASSRLSTQSMVSTMSEAPSQLSVGDEQAGEDDSILTTATNTTAKGRKKKATTAKGKGKAVKGKRTASSLAVDDSIALHSEPPAPFEEPIEEEQHIDEPPKRQTRRKVSQKETSHIEDTLNSSQISKPTRMKANRGKAKQRLTEDESQLQAELQASVEATLMDREETLKPKRGTKRTSNGAPKLDSSLVFLEEAPSELQDKPRRGRPKKNSALPQREAEEQDESAGPRSSLASEPPQRVPSLPTKGPKSKKGKKGAKAAPVEPEPEPEPEVEFEPEIVEPEPEVEPEFIEPESEVEPEFIEPEPEVEPEIEEPEPEELEPEVAETEHDDEEQDFDFARSLVNPVNPYQPMEGTPEPPEEEEEEASTTPSTPTPARVRQPGSSSAVRQSYAATPLRVSASHKGATPSLSPQSSDAENKPPSSRPESVRPPLSVPRLPAQPVFAPPAPAPSSPPAPATTRRVPLAETTPAHVNRSPSKRNVLGGIKSSLPWSPTALENVFLNSPVKANLAASSSAHTFPNIDMETADLRNVVGAVKHVMTDAEKKMTVGEWIDYNAKMAEQRLKSECEERVMIFEKEGGRALLSLEGIECAE
ncbi:hypothetical protein Vi05172_g9667 [Venturia inaequalis]|uniref:Uncharacterized protein n=1 Tax=Venturia inaequalis TaxID=5025 RepID=A0A8H3ZDQ5_VENIN|nr:hypothetical protein EG327_008857 [Venturia inaequalis]RDI80201.1 hypothetical protein Vi05172_g9667 [Venturia inaequalis]